MCQNWFRRFFLFLKKYENENGQKHIMLVNLGFREYQNRIQHVHKSVHAKYELCSCQERRVMTSLRQNRYLRIQGRMQIFRSISCFWMFNLQPFLDLINSKCCTHEYYILNFSDLEKVEKTFFKNTKYQSEKKHICLAKEFWSQCHILRIIYVLYVYYICIICIIYVLYM